MAVVTRYERSGASSRMRFYQYLPSLRQAGLEVFTAPLFSNEYVEGLQSGNRKLWEIFRAYAARLEFFFSLGKIDRIWIENEALPWVPAKIEQAILGEKVPFVLDYDDAVFHQYDHHANYLVRLWLGDKHLQLMRRAATVVAGNDYIATYARNAGASAVEVLPTVVDLLRYPVTSRQTNKFAPPLVGWIGQRVTARYLVPLSHVFCHLAQAGIARFSAVGVDAKALGLPMDSKPWSEATEVEAIGLFDIGIMPLSDGPFERGKCGYKLIQYMACGLPVVASPVGVNSQIVEHGVNGFLASTPQEWTQALKVLAADRSLRERMGRAGRQKVEQHYSLQATRQRLISLLRESVDNQQ